MKEHKSELANYETCWKTLSSNEFLSVFMTLHNIFFCNEGFFIFKNNELTKQFLQAIIKHAPIFFDYPECWSVEGQILQFMMMKKKFKNHLQVLPPKTQGHFYGNSNRYEEDKCLVCHNSCIDKEKCFEFMKIIAQNTYWKPYNFV